ncbi:MAG: hypothetical protein ACREMJ_12430 [Gemmatimonadales bacterium]
MVVLVSLVPWYIVIASLMPGRTLHVPEVALDRVVPLRPTWALVYAGVRLACVAYAVFVRPYPREGIPELDRRLAPVFALGVIGIIAIALACFGVGYRLSGTA